MNINSAQKVSPPKVIILLFLFVFNCFLNASDDIRIVATAVCYAAFVQIKAANFFVAVVVCCFFQNYVFSDNIAILFKRKRMFIHVAPLFFYGLFDCAVLLYYAQKALFMICNKTYFFIIFYNK